MGINKGFVGKNNHIFREHEEWENSLQIFNDGKPSGIIPKAVFEDIGEYALSEQGIWVSKDNHLVVRLKISDEVRGRCVLVVGSDGAAQEWEYRPSKEWTASVAQEYFEELPLHRPWHDAKPGDVYRLLWKERMDYAVVDENFGTLLFRFGDYQNVEVVDENIEWAEWIK